MNVWLVERRRGGLSSLAVYFSLVEYLVYRTVYTMHNVEFVIVHNIVIIQ